MAAHDSGVARYKPNVPQSPRVEAARGIVASLYASASINNADAGDTSRSKADNHSRSPSNMEASIVLDPRRSIALPNRTVHSAAMRGCGRKHHLASVRVA